MLGGLLTCLKLQVQPENPEGPRGWEPVLLSLLMGLGQEVQPGLLGPEIFDERESLLAHKALDTWNGLGPPMALRTGS